MISLGGFYRFGTWALSDRPAQDGASVSIDGTAGGRYTHLNMDLDFKGIGTVSGTKDWIDPVVGLRTLFDFTERWTLTLEGSVGGFGVGSDFTWHAGGLVVIGSIFSGKKMQSCSAATGPFPGIMKRVVDGTSSSGTS